MTSRTRIDGPSLLSHFDRMGGRRNVATMQGGLCASLRLRKSVQPSAPTMQHYNIHGFRSGGNARSQGWLKVSEVRRPHDHASPSEFCGAVWGSPHVVEMVVDRQDM